MVDHFQDISLYHTAWLNIQFGMKEGVVPFFVDLQKLVVDQKLDLLFFYPATDEYIVSVTPSVDVITPPPRGQQKGYDQHRRLQDAGCTLSLCRVEYANPQMPPLTHGSVQKLPRPGRQPQVAFGFPRFGRGASHPHERKTLHHVHGVHQAQWSLPFQSEGD